MDSKWTSDSRHTLAFTAANVFFSASVMVGNFAATRMLTPFEYGCVQSGSLLLGYLWFISFGVIQGFTQSYPLLLGAGRTAEAEQMAVGARAFGRGVAVIGLTLGLGLAGVLSLRHAPAIMVAAALVHALVIGVEFLSAIPSCTLIARGQWGALIRIRWWSGVASLGLLGAVWWLGATGQALRFLGMSVTAWLLLAYYNRNTQAGRIDWVTTRTLVRKGFPIMIAVALLTAFAILDRTVIAWTLGPEAVGVYTVAGLVIAALGGVQASLSAVYYNRANLACGKAPGFGALPAIWQRYLLVSLGVAVVAAVATYVCAPPFVKAFMPRYIGGIQAAQIAGLTAPVQYAAGASFLLLTLNRAWLLAAVTALCFAGFLMAALLLPRGLLSLTTVAWLRLWTLTAMALGVNGFLYFRLLAHRSRGAMPA